MRWVEGLWETEIWWTWEVVGLRWGRWVGRSECAGAQDGDVEKEWMWWRGGRGGRRWWVRIVVVVCGRVDGVDPGDCCREERSSVVLIMLESAFIVLSEWEKVERFL